MAALGYLVLGLTGSMILGLLTVIVLLIVFILIFKKKATAV